ncbi:MAG: superfamily II DNA or RNA helicase [Oleiphilaceae bacterium]|jgi:superfamily II DNA or RNA helicase
MKLRAWQSECITKILKQFSNGKNHFLTLATPGSGKTLMASVLADRLLKSGLVDLVLCFSPSSIVAQDFAESMALTIKSKFDGLMGAKGDSLTYQSLLHLDETFWQLFDGNRILVIFDEIHHCAGSNLENANAWGEQILLNIQNKAQYTLALTGTPWRSDTAPIVLSQYSNPDSKISCDYIYGLAQALRDNVCRLPQIIAIDNNQISLAKEDETLAFNSFSDLLSNSNTTYQEVIEHEDVIKYLISSSNIKLTQIRQVNPDAAGLIVASSIKQAYRISLLVKSWFNEDAIVVTYKEINSSSIIKEFRNTTTKWIISVGMISEGTNVPRLQVCCHLTNIKTEMHFRQILGRILRVTESVNQQAILYMPAEPKLLEYAYRVKDDIPLEADVVKFETMQSSDVLREKQDSLPVSFDTPKPIPIDIDANLEVAFSELNESFNDPYSETVYEEYADQKPDHQLSTAYDSVINIFGRFKLEAVALGLTDLR